jgi:hypothetical protein
VEVSLGLTTAKNVASLSPSGFRLGYDSHFWSSTCTLHVIDSHPRWGPSVVSGVCRCLEEPDSSIIRVPNWLWQQAALKRPYVSTRLHGVTSQNYFLNFEIPARLSPLIWTSLYTHINLSDQYSLSLPSSGGSPSVAAVCEWWGERTDVKWLNTLVRGKAIPLQTWTGPEGSRRMRLPDFVTVGTWRWFGCQPYAPAAFTP